MIMNLKKKLYKIILKGKGTRTALLPSRTLKLPILHTPSSLPILLPRDTHTLETKNCEWEAQFHLLPTTMWPLACSVNSLSFHLLRRLESMWREPGTNPGFCDKGNSFNLSEPRVSWRKEVISYLPLGGNNNICPGWGGQYRLRVQRSSGSYLHSGSFRAPIPSSSLGRSASSSGSVSCLCMMMRRLWHTQRKNKSCFSPRHVASSLPVSEGLCACVWAVLWGWD